MDCARSIPAVVQEYNIVLDIFQTVLHNNAGFCADICLVDIAIDRAGRRAHVCCRVFFPDRPVGRILFYP